MLRRWLPRIAAAIAAVLLASACGESARPPAAVVLGAEISEGQLRHAIPEFRFLTSLRQAPCGQPAKGETATIACSRFALGQLIEQELVANYARRHDLTVSKDTIHGSIAPLQQQLGGRHALQSRLEGQGLTFDDLRELAGRLLLVQEVAQDVAKRTVTDAVLRQKYREQRVQFTTLHAQHILFGFAQRKLAERIAKIVTPQNFAALARKYSTDPGSASRGGDLGDVPASQLDSSFAQAALALQPGEISGVVQTQFGWHIIRLISSRTIPFSQVRAELVTQVAPDVFVPWLRRQARGNAVDVNPRFGRFSPRTGLVQAITCTADTPLECRT
jgi:hypothetical protein